MNTDMPEKLLALSALRGLGVPSEYAEREQWEAACAVFGVDRSACRTFDAAILDWARTMIYGNSALMAAARAAALDELRQGHAWPDNPQDLLERRDREARARLCGDSPQTITPAEKDAALRAYEKQLYGPYPASNRHERRRAAKLNRQQ